ncbi:MAG: hypothetical protein R2681_03910 [Pyrinomonadaceae bacterium]
MGFFDYFSSGTVITDMDALKSAVDTTTKNLENAKHLPYFKDKLPGCYGKFVLAEKRLKEVSSALGKVQKVKALADSAKKIRWALSVLDDEYALRFNSDKAAIAIGVILVEFGHIVQCLPKPVSGYSLFLTEFGGNFTNVVNMLTPQKRKGQREQWEQLGFSIAAN